MSREPRDKVKDEDLLYPLDIYKLGSEDDPCFGKHHDLKAPECNMCGDAQHCSVMMAYNLSIKRIKIESDSRFKDLEEADLITKRKEKEAIVYIKEKKRAGWDRMLIIIRCSKKLNLTKDKVKEIYNQLMEEE